MIVFISIALVSALMGYIFCLSLSKCTVNKRTQRYLLKKRLTSTKEYLTPRKKTHESVDAHFDQTKVTIGSRSNAALQSLFDVLLKEYIDFWYKPLTSNPDFMIQLKVFLQYACAVIVQRVKNVKFSEFLIHRFIPHFFDHVIHILSLTSSENLAASNVGEMHKKSGTILKEQKQFQKSSLKSCPEEVVLSALSDRLHAALYSRQAEVMYLRAMVNRLLPFLSMPPSLSPDIHKSEGSTVGHSSRLRRNRVMNISPGRLQCSPDIENQSPVTRSVSSGALFLQKLVKLGCNPSSYSFLIEILSTCVLLPAMDILANSDFLNHLILLCFSGNTDPEPLKKHDCEHVPLLEAYIHDWQKWLSKKPSSSLHLETLLSHQDELYPFMQYMKSVKSIGPLTVVLLMHQINSRVSKRILSFDACHEIEAQIRHILSILHDDDTTTTSSSSSSSWTSPTDFAENYSNSDGESINHKVSTSFTHQKTSSTSISPSNSNSNDLQLYTISTEFEELLEGSLNMEENL
ncbi:unnamed protein product [Heterobilharzia americana]|nr:unnamed protein product [Heterobilharzia americana]